MRLDAITVIIATGAHRGATADDVRRKVGDVASRVRVISHDPIHDVVETGVSLAGHAVNVNREFLAADLRIGISGVMPHPFAGFSGGGKIVLPGLSDLDAVVRSHKYALMGFAGGPHMNGNKFRSDMERAVREIGLHWTVNVVLNSGCDTAAIVSGDLVEAHRSAVERARTIGATAPPARVLDALVLNAYPKDTELLQVGNAFNVLRSRATPIVKPDGLVVLLAACYRGVGDHQLFKSGGSLYVPPRRRVFPNGPDFVLVSPGLNRQEFYTYYGTDDEFFSNWSEFRGYLEKRYPHGGTVLVFPAASMQLAGSH
jgi:nickel-dependent lactate racemase